MTEVERLTLRLTKIQQYLSSIEEEKGTFLWYAAAEEYENIQRALAKATVQEYLDADENFEKEVLK